MPVVFHRVYAHRHHPRRRRRPNSHEFLRRILSARSSRSDFESSVSALLNVSLIFSSYSFSTQIRRYAALIQLRQEVLALRQEEEPRNPEEQESHQLPLAVPDLIPGTCDLPTVDEQKVPTTSSNTGKLKDGEM